MTKLYCPKGHETKHIEDLNIIGGWENLKCIDKGDTVFCANCSRRYFAIDCLSEPHVNDINAVETKVNPSDMQKKSCTHIWNYPDIASNSKGICTKCGATTDEITALPLDQLMQWVNPKRESQVAIERVIEAFRASVKHASEKKGVTFDMLNENLAIGIIIGFLNKLEGFNK